MVVNFWLERVNIDQWLFNFLIFDSFLFASGASFVFFFFLSSCLELVGLQTFFLSSKPNNRFLHAFVFLLFFFWF